METVVQSLGPRVKLGGFHSALGAAYGDFPALIWRVGHQGIGHKGPLPVFYGQRHGVIDIDLLREYASIPIIAVLGLTAIVHFPHPGNLAVLIDICAVSRMGTGAASLPPFLTGGSVKTQRPVGINLLRLLSDEPVYNVKMMSGLMYQQTPAVLQLPVPSAEIIRAVNRIQHPLEMHVQHFSHHALSQQFLHSGKQRHISAVKSHRNLPPVAFLRVQNGITALLVHGHGFFTDHIHAPIQGFHHILTVETVYGGNDGAVRPNLLHHPVKIRVDRHRIGNQALHILRPLTVYIHDPRQMSHIPVSLRDSRSIHPIASPTGSHQNIFFHIASSSFICFCFVAIQNHISPKMPWPSSWTQSGWDVFCPRL